MTYIALRFDAAADAAEAWSEALLAAGAQSVDLSDPFAGTERETPLYGEPSAPVEGTWSTARVVALFAEGADVPGLVREAARSLAADIPPYEMCPVADEDWVRATQSQFGPIEVAPDLFVVPTWSAVPRPDARVIRLDPGLAFGTGSHPTTRLCLEWLRETVAGGESVLDYGCGSGILAIAAAKLGAGRVTGVDLDGQALTASADNARANDVRATFLPPDALPPGASDIVVANILANPLILLAPALCARVLRGGRLALSGILEPQVEAVVAAYAPWFTLAAWRAREGWVLLSGQAP